MTDHPITPPDELVWKWHLEWCQLKVKHIRINEYMAAQGAKWGANRQLQLDAKQINHAWQEGADHELEACCGFIGCEHSVAWSSKLRAARRPQPPSLKEQALAALRRQAVRSVPSLIATEDCDTIRKALEALPE